MSFTEKKTFVPPSQLGSKTPNEAKYFSNITLILIPNEILEIVNFCENLVKSFIYQCEDKKLLLKYVCSKIYPIFSYLLGGKKFLSSVLVSFWFSEKTTKFGFDVHIKSNLKSGFLGNQYFKNKNKLQCFAISYKIKSCELRNRLMFFRRNILRKLGSLKFDFIQAMSPFWSGKHSVKCSKRRKLMILCH